MVALGGKLLRELLSGCVGRRLLLRSLGLKSVPMIGDQTEHAILQFFTILCEQTFSELSLSFPEEAR